MKQVMTFKSLSQISKLVLVICPDKWGIHHPETYLRYLIIIDIHSQAIWIDDVDEQTVTDIVSHSPPDVKLECFQAPCPWCQSRDGTDPSTLTN